MAVIVTGVSWTDEPKSLEAPTRISMTIIGMTTVCLVVDEMTFLMVMMTVDS